MAAIKHIAGLILAFILGMSIMILFYELSSQSNPSTPRNAQESLSLYDYAQIICIEDSPIWRLQEIRAGRMGRLGAQLHQNLRPNVSNRSSTFHEELPRSSA